jgi:hypothetical protein
MLSAVALTNDRTGSSLVLEIRSCAQTVAEQSPHVVVLRDRIAEVAAQFEVPPGPAGIGTLLDPDLQFLGHGPATVAYLVTLGTLRFGSGYHPRLAKRSGFSVGQSLVASLTARFEAQGPFEVDELIKITTEDCAELFGQDLSDSVQGELMDLFSRALRDLGRMLREQYAGSFTALVESADGSAVRLVDTLAQVPYFADVQRYRGLEVPFFLRAQRIVIDLAQAFLLEGPGRFTDLDVLAPSADNAIAHVLRMDGVLRYDRGLMERIDRGEPVPAHSEREVEIRAAAIHGVELIRHEVAKTHPDVTTLHIDTWLRARGRAPAYRAKPRHRSRTVLY